jgi:hypothetical protein
MAAMRYAHLLIGGPNPGSPNIPANLARLLARGDRRGDSAPRLTTALARLFGMEGAALAPILLAAEDIEAGPGQYFRADPVHLLAGMHSLSLLDSRHFRLAADEAQALTAALNAHFAGEAEFLAPHPLRWYARLESNLRVETPPLDQVTAGLIEPGLIAGPDAATLQRLAMEIQMLLHAHPVNDAREERGEPPVNSVWFWGNGEQRQPKKAFDQVLSRNFTSTALARAVGIPCRPPDELPTPVAGNILLDLDPSLDDALIGAVLERLQRRRLDEALIEMPGREAPMLRLTPWSAWKIWAK